jgi:hypothetical protein
MKGFLTILLVAFLFWWVVLAGESDVMSTQDWWIVLGLCVMNAFWLVTRWVWFHGRAR